MERDSFGRCGDSPPGICPAERPLADGRTLTAEVTHVRDILSRDHQVVGSRRELQPGHGHTYVPGTTELAVADLGSDRVHRLEFHADSGTFGRELPPVVLSPGSGRARSSSPATAAQPTYSGKSADSSP
jgi:hypothetical protein